jgi:hypothetical protein
MFPPAHSPILRMTTVKAGSSDSYDLGLEKEETLSMKQPDSEAVYLQMDRQTKEGLFRIAKYRHTSFTNLMEEAGRMMIHRESARIREDLSDLHEVNQMVRH